MLQRATDLPIGRTSPVRPVTHPVDRFLSEDIVVGATKCRSERLATPRSASFWRVITCGRGRCDTRCARTAWRVPTADHGTASSVETETRCDSDRHQLWAGRSYYSSMRITRDSGTTPS